MNVISRFPPFLDIMAFIKHCSAMTWYLRDYIDFKRQSTSSGLIVARLSDSYPCLDDRTQNSPFDTHYIYHPAWAAKIIAKTKPRIHHDFSSLLSFSTIISAFVPTVFYDYRPASLKLESFSSLPADLTNLTIKSNSLKSVSCMHVLEHIGLGRYGDPIDPEGDVKAIAELRRVVASNGNLLIVVPIAEKSRLMFNAHRVYTYSQIISLFPKFELMNFSLVTDTGEFVSKASKKNTRGQKYGCGCFWFKKVE